MRALLLLALLVIPVAAADHVYSHRFVLDGRLVGSDGAPLAGREVEFFSDGDFLQPCREGARPVTDEFGDFRFCYHIHDLDARTKAGARYGNASVVRAVDVAFRRVSVLLREPNETGVAPPGWNATYRISGRVWEPGPVLLEGVQVYGVAQIGTPVNLTVRAADGSETPFASKTDGFGDFDLVIETPADPSTLSVSLEAHGRAQPVQLDAFFHRAWAPVYVTPAGAPTQRDPGPAAPLPDAPGSATPHVNPVFVVAIVLALVGAILLSRRKAA